MTETEYKQIQEIFKPVRTIDEVQKINDDINEINSILSTFPFDIEAARQKIKSVNDEHLDNRLFYLLLNPPKGQSILIDNAPSDGLKNDLAWKRDYLI
ncbi:MAG: hypothetical protein NC543_04240 [bacterium]|nr:hypothetical protein [bacterium]MCM1233233.1 hypothetical protein [Ruminococcus flavefaciens]